MDEQEFKEKTRRLLFNTELRNFPVVFEMYTRSFKLDVNADDAMGKIISIIRTSPDADTAYNLVCHYLDTLEA